MSNDSFLALLKEADNAQKKDKQAFSQEVADIVPLKQDTIEKRPNF